MQGKMKYLVDNVSGNGTESYCSLRSNHSNDD